MRVLDLFCGAGGAAMGLHQAWPDAEIVGVDINSQPRYPFTFICADALLFSKKGLQSYDFIWASPPCQCYSGVTPKSHRHLHPDLIEEVQTMLASSGKPFVIENVIGARRKMINPFMLCGSMFGLRTQRHRLFDTFGFNCFSPKICDHSQRPLLVTTAGANSRAIRKPGEYKSVKNAPLAYGIDWMTVDGLKEAIPPAYSRYIAEQFDKWRAESQPKGKGEVR